MEDFQLYRNDEGAEFVQFTERPKKTKHRVGCRATRTGISNHTCSQSVKRGARERGPPNLHWSGPFNKKLNDNMRFNCPPKGENTITR